MQDQANIAFLRNKSCTQIKYIKQATGKAHTGIILHDSIPIHLKQKRKIDCFEFGVNQLNVLDDSSLFQDETCFIQHVNLTRCNIVPATHLKISVTPKKSERHFWNIFISLKVICSENFCITLYTVNTICQFFFNFVIL